jgi:hypothetical protein
MKMTDENMINPVYFNPGFAQPKLCPFPTVDQERLAASLKNLGCLISIKGGSG